MKIMKCGHSPNAINRKTNKPACVICFGDPEAEIMIEIPLPPGRKARCSMCKKLVDSNENLAFFKYLGEGSHDALHKCKCGYYDVAHEMENFDKCDKFVSHGAYEYDEYYCGCRGWD